MARETILQDATVSDEREDANLRPRSLEEVVGQHDVVERLQIAVDAAQKRNEAVGHVLLDGPPGLGKTTLAMCIPQALGSPLQITSGPLLKAPRDLLPYLTNAEERSVLFIDEIHRVTQAVEEYLYSAMEDFRLDIILGEGVNARTVNLTLQPFTLIGATTRAGMLSGPLRDRFQIREHVQFYGEPELQTIVHRSARRLQVELHDEAATEIARRSRGTPRIANNLLRWIRDYAESRADGIVTRPVADAALAMAQIDPQGLGPVDRQYLKTLIQVFGGGPAGLGAVAHTMNISSDTLEDEVEPFLLRSGWLVRTPRGRMVTAAGYQQLGLEPPSDDQPRLF